MKIITYQKRYRKDFIRLNRAWIKSNFGFLENEDIETFEHFEDELEQGSMIYLAVTEHEEVMAVCMVRPMDGDTWEICKLAAHEAHKGCGAGSGVFKACMDYAITQGAHRLFILSNSILTPALHIYHKFGFQEIKLDNYEYKRGNIAFEYLVQALA